MHPSRPSRLPQLAALLCLSSLAGAQIIRGGDLVATNYGTPGLFRIEPNATVTQIAGSSQLKGPAGVIVTRKREIVLVDYSANTLLKWDQNGAMSTIAGSLGGPVRVTEDLDGNFLVVALSPNALLRVTPGGAVTTLIPKGTLGRLWDVAVD